MKPFSTQHVSNLTRCEGVMIMQMDPYSTGGFDIFNALFVIVPVIILGVFAYILIKGVSQWSSNNKSSILSVPAEVVTKRSHTSGGAGDSSASTWYYVTFQVESGDRIELPLNGSEYGMLAEEDLGILTFQGTLYKGFERRKNVE